MSRRNENGIPPTMAAHGSRLTREQFRLRRLPATGPQNLPEFRPAISCWRSTDSKLIVIAMSPEFFTISVNLRPFTRSAAPTISFKRR